MVLVTAPRSFLSKRSFVWKMSALSTPYFSIAAWKQYQSVKCSESCFALPPFFICIFWKQYQSVNLLCFASTCSTTMFSISLKPAPDVFILFIDPGQRAFINLHSFWWGRDESFFICICHFGQVKMLHVLHLSLLCYKSWTCRGWHRSARLPHIPGFAATPQPRPGSISIQIRGQTNK